MAYDEQLANRIRKLISARPGFEEKKMFGGVGFLLNGNLACGVHKNYLIVRVGPDAYDDALDDPFSKPFDITGRPMTGWVLVDPGGISSEQDLVNWIRMGLDYTLSHPAK